MLEDVECITILKQLSTGVVILLQARNEKLLLTSENIYYTSQDCRGRIHCSDVSQCLGARSRKELPWQMISLVLLPVAAAR